MIPIPASVTHAEGAFELSTSTRIILSPNTKELQWIGHFLSTQIRRATGLSLPVLSEGNLPQEGAFHLTTQDVDSTLEPEGYTLNVTPHDVQIAAPRPAGVFYGVQTLLQLLPPEIESNSAQSGHWTIKAVSIRDWPRFSWRGSMLDVARHFFGVEDVKRYIDLLAAYKLNVLHLHLTDDQGWRIEIRSWPKLTEIGAKTAVDGFPGGYYSQTQYAEIVDYARQRYITIVPEIDMPGHINAALVSYPELTCDNLSPALYTGTEVGFSSLCIEKEITYQFINDVLEELATLTPGSYLHIGGDEAHSTPKDAYKSFIERIEAMVNKLGKQMVGWEEIIQGNLSSSSIVQYWKEETYARMAVEKGMRMILSPAPKTYLDMKYHADTALGLSWAGLLDVEKAYNWDPGTEVSGLQEQSIMGVEAPVWTETLRTMQDVEFMAFPRILGIAEINWSPARERNWESYRNRLVEHGQRLQWKHVNFYRDPKVPWSML